MFQMWPAYNSPAMSGRVPCAPQGGSQDKLSDFFACKTVRGVMNMLLLNDLLENSLCDTSLPEDVKDWEEMKPIGKEFGSKLTFEEQDDAGLVRLVNERKDQLEIYVNIDEL